MPKSAMALLPVRPAAASHSLLAVPSALTHAVGALRPCGVAFRISHAVSSAALRVSTGSPPSSTWPNAALPPEAYRYMPTLPSCVSTPGDGPHARHARPSVTSEESCARSASLTTSKSRSARSGTAEGTPEGEARRESAPSMFAACRAVTRFPFWSHSAKISSSVAPETKWRLLSASHVGGSRSDGVTLEGTARTTLHAEHINDVTAPTLHDTASPRRGHAIGATVSHGVSSIQRGH